jgi:hypothetical protein
LESGKICVVAHQINKSNIHLDVEKIKNGQKVIFDNGWHTSSDVLSFDIYPKYFFSHLGEEGAPQWSHVGSINHSEKNQSQDLEDFTFLLKNAYALALEVSGLKTY